jgi:hypothetical protein
MVISFFAIYQTLASHCADKLKENPLIVSLKFLKIKFLKILVEVDYSELISFYLIVTLYSTFWAIYLKIIFGLFSCRVNVTKVTCLK